MSVPPPSLKAVTLAHFWYQLGHLLAWISLVRFFFYLGGFVSHFLFHRELHTFLFSVGLFLSHVIIDTFKTAVHKSGPAVCHLLETYYSHGWPSSHSQCMFLFATYLSLVDWHRDRRFGVCVATWALAVLTMYSWFTWVTTVGQVFVGVGATLGNMLSGIWYFALSTSCFGRTSQRSRIA